MFLRARIMSQRVKFEHHGSKFAGVMEWAIPVPLGDKRDPEREKEVAEALQVRRPKDEEA
jgi:hypothetical protein